MAEWQFYPTSTVTAMDAAGKRRQEKYVGRTTRMGIEQYQDYTLYINEDRGPLRGRHLTDEQLRADWQHEFPDAVRFTLDHMHGVRRDYIKGTDRSAGSGSAHGVRDATGQVVAGGESRSH